MLFQRHYKLKINDVEISDSYRLMFNCFRSISTPNSADILIFNPSENIKVESARGAKISLSVGYGESALVEIFNGTISNPMIQYDLTDRILLLKCTSLNYKLDEPQPTITTIENKISLVDLLKSLAKTYDKTLDVTDNEDFNNIKVSDMSFSGNSRSALNQLGQEYDFYWNIDGEYLIITLKNITPDNDNIITDINANTGMLGIPQVDFKGVNVRQLLNPKITPSVSFTVTSFAYNFVGGINLYTTKLNTSNIGDQIDKLISPTNEEIITLPFIAFEVAHVGDTHDNTWETKINGFHGKRYVGGN